MKIINLLQYAVKINYCEYTKVVMDFLESMAAEDVKRVDSPISEKH